MLKGETSKKEKRKERRHFPNDFIGIMQIHRSKNPKLAHATKMTIRKVNPTDCINKLSREKNILDTDMELSYTARNPERRKDLLPEIIKNTLKY